MEELEACVAYTLSDSSETEYEFENTVHDNVLDLAKTANNTFENFLNVFKCIITEMHASKYLRTVSHRIVVIHGFINV